MPFNLLVGRITDSLRRIKHGYRMGDKVVKILCYADNAVLFADGEDGLQWLLQAFNREVHKLGIEISTTRER